LCFGLKTIMNYRRQEQRKAREYIERLLLWMGRSCFFILGYYTVSKILVNWYLGRFTTTGWQFEWELFGFFKNTLPMLKS
jgi:hypothetical protein